MKVVRNGKEPASGFFQSSGISKTTEYFALYCMFIPSGVVTSFTDFTRSSWRSFSSSEASDGIEAGVVDSVVSVVVVAEVVSSVVDSEVDSDVDSDVVGSVSEGSVELSSDSDVVVVAEYVVLVEETLFFVLHPLMLRRSIAESAMQESLLNAMCVTSCRFCQ